MLYMYYVCGIQIGNDRLKVVPEMYWGTDMYCMPNFKSMCLLSADSLCCAMTVCVVQ